ncbi:MAG TPA: tRNA (adenosine(37)-N6)-threonylcarbamoyltransferase complex transferase subunit TsaD [Patescibacteria group bacterium]|nr:tRNA (adenosine(37)-N6)-threonylcarbamoyltransferase complex transferase subunit TsaD [Patescibacteria group bacterium]
MRILAIETSCDETSAAVYDTAEGLLSNVVASQIDIHKKTGGVVPEVASRAHVEQILPVLDEALQKAKTSLKKIDYIAVTHAPGLIGSLLVGVNTAKMVSAVLDKPILPMNHLEGHIYANFIDRNKNFKFPAVVLLVSGGHTSLILMKDHGKYKYLGETLDDAAGEAFDKVARVLELPYPGGPNISAEAERYRRQISNFQFPISNEVVASPQHKELGSGKFFPRSMMDSKDFNFSFSGLKTSVLYKWQDFIKNNSKPSTLNAIPLFCYEFEEAVVDILTTKTIKAAEKYKAKTVSICGGVAANKRLREEIGVRVKNKFKKVSFCVPPIEYCGDNAAMIAACAAYQLKNKKNKKSFNLDFEVMSNKEL